MKVRVVRKKRGDTKSEERIEKATMANLYGIGSSNSRPSGIAMVGI